LLLLKLKAKVYTSSMNCLAYVNKNQPMKVEYDAKVDRTDISVI